MLDYFKQIKLMPQELLTVRVITPHKTIYTGQALAVSSSNSAGDFDILPEHANFITLVENVPIKIITENRETKEFNFSQALIYNASNSVSIYAEPLSL